MYKNLKDLYNVLRHNITNGERLKGDESLYKAYFYDKRPEDIIEECKGESGWHGEAEKTEAKKLRKKLTSKN